jgi:hypothetical protein
MQDVLDLQLLDPLVWESGASEQQRLLRLKGYMKINTEKVPWFYKNVYQVTRPGPRLKAWSPCDLPTTAELSL